MAQTLRSLPITRETPIQSLRREDPLEKEMATHSSILAWKIQWIEKPARLQSIGVPKSRTRLSDFTSSTEQPLISENRAVWFWLSKIRKARLALLEHIQISERLLWV